jgi:hypothetical protein
VPEDILKAQGQKLALAQRKIALESKWICGTLLCKEGVLDRVTGGDALAVEGATRKTDGSA